MILGSAALFLLSFFNGCDGATRRKIDKSDEAQKGRAEIIQELTQKGLFAKIEEHQTSGGSRSVDLWVRPVWYTLDYDEKGTFTNTVYSYYFDGTSISDRVAIFDSKTGNVIGQYSLATGGLHLSN